ncbi:hypothetical protein PNEG_01288 [Pneumocystis murina B123]|uniref:HTH APSES-type domain-containing protein n=1 Tax=Pneumocystis murina (strain B123) TaxID=1069680 RepID=M7NPE5_PNEMU|nr:hypothetical protein PNEG_01288 [Pneumocystis murina B123]EMR10583.1 hypothetical protein PNEG_01288 [Pneumocystis murina B123]
MSQPKILKTTYSGVPVYEYVVKGIAVMRRYSDSYINATQILKVADFDKPQRTRILEREVQKGEHEKVQGGYGKYQGTWIPLSRALELAQQYKVEDLLKPILDCQPNTKSPPVPKQITSTSKRTPQSTPTQKLLRTPKKHIPTDEDLSSISMDDSVSIETHSTQSNLESEVSAINSELDGGIGNRKRKYTQLQNFNNDKQFNKYSEALLDFFMSSNHQSLPDFLIHCPSDFNANSIIDEEGHTALHWACAMGHLRVVETLLDAGANISTVNLQGQTALMRSVLFTNNYDLKSFPQLMHILQPTIHLSDKFSQTVFHHIASTTTSRSKLLAAKYYAETILNRLSEIQPANEIAQLLDAKDSEGDTALTIFARNGARKCIRVLTNFHASLHIPNNQGRTAEEYIIEYERQRQSLPHRQNSLYLNQQSVDNYNKHYETSKLSAPYSRFMNTHSQPHLSEAAIKATQEILPEIQEKLKLLANAYDAELKDKEAYHTQALELLANMNREIEISRKSLQEIIGTDPNAAEIQKQTIENANKEMEAASKKLRIVIEKNQSRELARLIKEEILAFQYTTKSHENENRKEKERLIYELQNLQKERRKLIDTIVELFAAAGIGERMNEYRKLIAMSCGLNIEDVDNVLDAIEEVLTGNPDDMTEEQAESVVLV